MKPTISERRVIALATCICALLACNLQLGPTPAVPNATATLAAALPPTVPAIPANPTSAVTEAVAATATLTATQTPEATPTSSGPLTGTVLQRSNCRYGPGAFYLYKIGMREGAPVEVVGRTVDGGWAFIQYAGTKNLCWINSKLIQLNGDIMRLPDYWKDSASLPMASNYGPVSILSVSGSAAVTVEWAPIVLPDYALPGENEVQYVIEVWTCLNGSPAFYTLGTNETEMTFEVDDSCGQISRANIVAQNKLGVSGITPIPIP